MVDPALDSTGRMAAFLDKTIDEMKAKDAAPEQQAAPADDLQPVRTGAERLPEGTLMGETVAPGTPPAPAPAQTDPVVAKSEAAVHAALVRAAGPKTPVNKFALISKLVAAADKKLNQWADRLIERLGAFDTKVDATFDKHEDAITHGEAHMEMLEASLALVGNEGNEGS